MERHGGFLLVDTLIDHGVTHVFGMPGGQANAFYDALIHRKEEITHILIRDETTAGYAADAFARVSGRIGVCDATVGPGSAKLPSGLMEAYNSSIPILAIISDHPRDAVLLQDFGRISQGGDQISMLEPFAKETFHVPSTDMIPKVVAAAIHTAVSGRPGPVVVEIPQDVFNEESSVEAIAGDGSYPKFRCIALEEDMIRATKMLSQAKRPLVLAGGGVQLSQAHEEITLLMNTFEIPVVTTLSGKGSVSEESPLCVGVLGDFGNPAAKKLANKADVILAIGYKHSQNSSYRWTWPNENQKFIHIDIDPMEFGRIFCPDVSLWGDARETLKRLRSHLKREKFGVSKTWINEVLDVKREWEKIRFEECSNNSVPIWPQSVMQAISEQMKETDYIVCDASFASGWGAGFFKINRSARQVILPRGAAGLGYSLPAAIGICMARPNSRVICITGDGAFSYNVGELATLKQFNLPIINIVLNNGTLSWAKWTQKLNFSGLNQSVELGDINYGSIARSYGISGINIERVEDLGPAIKNELNARRPSVIDVLTDEWQAPTIPYRQAMERAKQGVITSQVY